MIVAEGPDIEPAHLSAGLRRSPSPGPLPGADPDAPLPTLEALERAHIELALKRTKGHRGGAAAILGISERNLYRKISEYRLPDQDPDA